MLELVTLTIQAEANEMGFIPLQWLELCQAHISYSSLWTDQPFGPSRATFLSCHLSAHYYS